MKEDYRKGYVFVKDSLVGIIEEIKDGYCFTYDSQYLSNPLAKAISLTLPLQEKTYISKGLFPFFDGLIPEGYLLDKVVDNWDLKYNDRFGLLLVACKDCIGDVTIRNQIDSLDYLNYEYNTKCTINTSSSLSKIDITQKKLKELFDSSINNGYTVPGVQKKVSFCVFHENSYLNSFILKPQTSEYANLPEYEDLGMRLANCVGINTIPHALISINNQYAYITKRIDREYYSNGCNKYAMEDFCQLANHLTIDKYKSSYEYCGKIITKYSSRPGVDIVEMFYRIIFSYVIGNSDMHLKNFSLIENEPGNRKFILSEAYDMLPVNAILPEDTEQMALTVNGKKKNILYKDFIQLAKNCNIPEKVAFSLIEKICSYKEEMLKEVDESYLLEEQKEKVSKLIIYRINIFRK